MPENVMKPDPDQSVQPDMGLVEQIIADDADAFGRLFRKYYESLYRFADDKSDLPALRKQAYKEGMLSLRLSGAQKVAAGLTTVNEVLRVTPDMQT